MMSGPLLALATALCVSPAHAGGEIALSETGRMLTAPDIRDATPAQERRRHADGWPYRGKLRDLRIVNVLWSNVDGVATVRAPGGETHFVFVGSRLGEHGARVVRIADRRIELVEYTDNDVLSGTWCKLVIEEVLQRVAVLDPDGADEPAFETQRATRVRVVQCSLHQEHLDLPDQPAWAK